MDVALNEYLVCNPSNPLAAKSFGMNPLRVLYPILCLVYHDFVGLFRILSKGLMYIYCASSGNFSKYSSKQPELYAEHQCLPDVYHYLLSQEYALFRSWNCESFLLNTEKGALLSCSILLYALKRHLKETGG